MTGGEPTAPADAFAGSAAARQVKRLDEERSKYKPGNCEELGRASIKCIEENNYNRKAAACQGHFDAYKACRKEENDARRAKKLLW